MRTGPLDKSVEDALRAERPRRKVSPGFAERVIDALPSRPMNRAAAPPAHSRPRGLRLFLAGALAMVTLVGWLQFAPKPVQEPVAVAAVEPEPPAYASGLKLPPVTVQQMQALTAKIDEPLEKELKLVLSDTRNAIRFVASNFIPEN